MTLVVLGIYLLVVVAIGVASRRRGTGSGDDWFLATRTIGPVLLLLSLFGTHMTAFSLLGASGEAYRRGIGVFALMASSSALVAPAVFLLLGTRLWALGKRYGYRTQAELFSDRWGSRVVGRFLFAVLVLFLLPYLVIGVKGGGITLEQITGGAVPPWIGSLVMIAAVVTYVTAGGVRGTAWANAFQTFVFVTLGAVTFWVVVRELGGLGTAFARVAEERPELLVRGTAIRPLELATYACIPLSVAMFPHIFMHWLTARSVAAFRIPAVAYPLCIAAVWVPSVVLGVLGAAAVPGLEGPAAGGVLVRLIAAHAPAVLSGLLAAGVFAAVMSSLDSQSLALASMCTHDLVERGTGGASDARRVLLGRLFVVGVLGVAYLAALVVDRSIFRLGVWSFTGFAALTPLPVAALFWRRSSASGALASLATTAVLWAWFLHRGWSVPGYTVGGTGIMPVAVILVASAAAMVVGSLVGTPPEVERVRRFVG